MAIEKSGHESVLVVDNDHWVCETVREVLVSRGHKPFVCTDSGVAAGAIERQRFSLAFLDVDMDQVDGIKLAARIRESNPLCRIVLMTVYASIEKTIEATETGGMDYMRKPFRPVEIGFLLKRLSESKAAAERSGMLEESDRVVPERILLQQEKLKTLGSIAAEVAHEIRNPLVSIGGFARRLRKRLPEEYEADIIVRETERLEKILGRIRNYLRPVELTPRECSINEAVRGCLDLLSPEIKSKNISCRLDLDEAMPATLIDADIFTQVCINLIRNGLDASSGSKEIAIRTYQSTGELHVDFMNENSGKPMKNPEHLFLPLDRGGKSIGLPLCHRLLENMGGFLSFAEKEKQVVFTMSIPKEAKAMTLIEKIPDNPLADFSPGNEHPLAPIFQKQ